MSISLNLSQWLTLIIGFVSGLMIGLFYFGGLWLTLRQLPRINHPYLLIIVSFLIRLGISLLAFYLLIISLSQMSKLIVLLVSFLGFFLGRMMMIYYVKQVTQAKF